MKILFLGLFALCSFTVMADTTCISNTITGGHATPSVSTAIPSNGSLSGTVKINEYKINIDCDIRGRRSNHTLLLKIVAPNGETASTSTGNELKLINSSGDGVSVHCSEN